jgi:Arc/MetJ family transcription regulator
VAVRALAAERNELRARVLACPACGESFAHPDDHALRYPDIHEPEAARWNVNCEVQRTARGGWTVGCPNLEVALRTGAVGRDLGLGASRIFSNGDSSCDRHLVSWPDADALLAPAVPTRAADLATLSSAVDLAVTATAGEPDHADLKAGWEAALARLAEAVR